MQTIGGFHSVAEFRGALERPRKVMMMMMMMMMEAGEAVDSFIEQLLPYMSKDIIIDGGNSNDHDTIRRTAAFEAKGLLFTGTGVSGGEEGALKGPSVMPGGCGMPGP